MRKLFIEEEDLLQDAYRLGVRIYNDGFRPSFIVGLWRGGSAVGIYVQECLQYLGVETDHISVRTSYTGASSYARRIDDPGAPIRVHGTQYLLENLDAGDRLLIVDDVYSSGRSVAAVIERLRTRLKRNFPGDVRVATLWRRGDHGHTGAAPDYYLHDTDAWLVLPYELSGLSEEEIDRHKAFMRPILAPLRD